MVLVKVNPGRKLRDKVNQRDAVGGDLVEVRDVERKILIHRRVVSDPPANDSQAASPVAPGEQALDARTNAAKDAPVAPVGAAMEPEPAPVPEPAPEPEPEPGPPVDSTSGPEPRRGRYRRRDMTAEES